MIESQTRKKPGTTGFDRHTKNNSTTNSSATSSDPRVPFIDAMCAAGIVTTEPDRIAADGAIFRFNVEGDKQNKRDGWGVLFTDAHGSGGAFGHWRTGATGTWHEGGRKATRADRRRLAASIALVKRERDAERLALAKCAQERALRLWSQAASPHDHAYMARKCITACGSRQLNELLLIPMRDADGVLWNVQTITPAGTKRFLRGGRKRGLYHAIGPISSVLLICEGFATGASLRESTGEAVAVAFDCGNLEPVAKVLRAKFPDVQIVIAADNDISTDGNPGLTRATAAGRSVRGRVALPPEGFCDFKVGS